MVEDSLESMLFVGRFNYAADKKGRLLIPSEFRRVIAARNNSCNSIWLVPKKRNGAGYIACYDERIFKEKKKECFGADVECVVPDKHGRIVVKQWLRNYACLEDRIRIMVVASPDMESFEIWNKNLFDMAYKPKLIDGEQF